MGSIRKPDRPKTGGPDVPSPASENSFEAKGSTTGPPRNDYTNASMRLDTWLTVNAKAVFEGVVPVV